MEKNAKKLNEGKTRNLKLQNEIPKQYIEEGSNFALKFTDFL